MNNDHIQSVLSHPDLAGLDGELIVGEANDPNVFNNTTGPVRRKDGKPDFKLWIFDRIDMCNEPYFKRYESFCNKFKNHLYVNVLNQFLLNSPEDIIAFEQWCVEQGFEGAMIRSRDGLYKEGRCTFKEMNIFKRKPLEDDEAEVIGFVEQMENQNESFENELGLTVRSSHNENKVGKNTLGCIVVKSNKWKEPFPIGTGVGLTYELRQNIWFNQHDYLGKLITYKYQAHGSIDAPRQPIFKGFRDSADTTEF